MSSNYTNEPMLEMFLFETSQQVEQLEMYILECEKENGFSQDSINDIFRIMHTIKGSAAMMMFNDISNLAHSIEDIFYYLREEKPKELNYSTLSDLVLSSIDFIKLELEKIKNGDQADGKSSNLSEELRRFLITIKSDNNSYSINNETRKSFKNLKYYISQEKTIASSYKNMFKAVVYFEDGCEMENIRAYTIIHSLKDLTSEVYYLPEDIIDDDMNAEVIRQNGFTIYLKSDCSYEMMRDFFNQTIFLKDLELYQLEDDKEFEQFNKEKRLSIQDKPIKTPVIKDNGKLESVHIDHQASTNIQSMISVGVSKLDKLMDLVGEMVIAEAMVVQNPDLVGLELDNFQKAASQLNKITGEIQDMVMSIRMVPLSTTFHKMNRIIRDLSKKLHKEIELHIVGEDTEVDKNIIEHISDPLMHLVRNAIDHGIEDMEERLRKGKIKTGAITLKAKNAGSDVLIIVRDDGKGLDKNKILKKARENGLMYRAESEMTEREIFNLILLPGFSTKENISEISGRGVGMDIVANNIEAIGGYITVDSVLDQGTVITLKIPLTLAIIDGMNIKVGNSCYTIPTTSIKESFRPRAKDLIIDPDGNEMIMVRGKCFTILRLHKCFNVNTDVEDVTEGILIMVEQDNKLLCVFADELLGQQQVVVKALPEYIKKYKKIKGLAGCTLLGDGSISLILDVAGLISH